MQMKVIWHLCGEIHVGLKKMVYILNAMKGNLWGFLLLSGTFYKLCFLFSPLSSMRIYVSGMWELSNQFSQVLPLS